MSLLREVDYNILPVGAGAVALQESKYPNKRSEVWFQVALSLARLDRSTLARLKAQAMAPEWKIDCAGRHVVESKDITKDKLGRSLAAAPTTWTP